MSIELEISEIEEAHGGTDEFEYRRAWMDFDIMSEVIVKQGRDGNYVSCLVGLDSRSTEWFTGALFAFYPQRNQLLACRKGDAISVWVDVYRKGREKFGGMGAFRLSEILTRNGQPIEDKAEDVACAKRKEVTADE